MAGAHAGDIDLPEVVLLGQVVALVDDHLGGVVMQVDEHRALQQARHSRGIHFRLGEYGTRYRQKESELDHDARLYRR